MSNNYYPNEKEKMLKDIGTVSFFVADMKLYLDTHPFDRDGIEAFNHYCHIRNSMLRDFANKYYPLTVDTAEGCKEWTWGLAPAPWEGVC